MKSSLASRELLFTKFDSHGILFLLEGRHGQLSREVTVMTILEVIALLNLLATVIFGILMYIKK